MFNFNKNEKMKRSILKLLTMALIPVLIGCGNAQQISKMYVGVYTGRDVVNGLHVIDVDFTNGVFAPVSDADAGPSPSYICVSKKHNMLYAANEATQTIDDGVRVGSVTALKLNADGSIAEKVKEVYLYNGGACNVSLTPEEDFLLLAHYGAGSISVVRLDSNGLPTEVTDTVVFREEGIRSARGHMAAAGPNGKIYFTCLALDKVMIFDLNRTTGKLTQTGYGSTPEGAGPRHFTFSKDGSKLFVINELGSTMTVFDIASDGGLNEIQTISTLPDDWTGESFCADVHLSKDGQYLYGSNRGHNSIVTYKVAADGRLSVVGFTSCGGNWPRNFTLDPSGKYIVVGNQNARPNPDLQNQENLALFEIDKKTGLPVLPGKIYDIRQPACIKFME